MPFKNFKCGNYFRNLAPKVDWGVLDQHLLISEHLPVWNRVVLTRIALAADAAGVVAPFEDGADASTSEKRRLPMMQS